MAKIVNIVNGIGKTNLMNGTYTVSANVEGYNNLSLTPTNVIVNDNIDTYNFTIAATGTLTLHVTEEGTSMGTPVVGATFIRTDCAGNEYGEAITTDGNGNAVFNNVPFASTNAPVIYFKQLSSDVDHEFNSQVQSTVMTTSTQTIEIRNRIGELKTIYLTDLNYEDLPIANGTLIFMN